MFRLCSHHSMSSTLHDPEFFRRHPHLAPRWIPPRPVRLRPRESAWREALRFGTAVLLAAWAIGEIALWLG